MQEHWPTAKIVMTQYNTKKGVHKFGDQGDATVEKEVR